MPENSWNYQLVNVWQHSTGSALGVRCRIFTFIAYLFRQGAAFCITCFSRPPGLIKKNGKMYLKQKSMRQADKNHKFTPQENNTNFSAPIQAILQISLFSCCKGVQYKKMTQFSALVVIFLFFVA